ncbi:MAG: right-handed parallel beta-helix repeat-containing protein [Deltaproteobacteria bacterium]|nr:right-handed parallel beta-helix repeat-containing protein [Deltaproteobacteria bacterium]
MGVRIVKDLSLIAALTAALLLGCAKTDVYRNSPAGDADSDSDSDADSDSDSDSDADSDSDTDPNVPPDCVVYVDAASPAGEDGQTWATAVNKVRQGIAFAVELTSEFEVCHVWVAEGLYYVYDDGIDDTVQLQPGVHLYGGFKGDEATFSEREWQDHPTILSGIPQSSSSDSTCHVVTGADDSVLDGFIVTGGGCLEFYNSGGGMLNLNASPTVRNCDFIANDAYEGGGMANWEESAPWIENCGFYDNWADPNGAAGGMVNDNSSPTISNCRFINNFGNHGGAINNHESTVEIVNCVFAFNTSPEVAQYAIDNTKRRPT